MGTKKMISLKLVIDFNLIAGLISVIADIAPLAAADRANGEGMSM